MLKHTLKLAGGGGVAIVTAVAVLAAFALTSGPVEAAGAITFDAAPSDLSVTSGEADAKVGTIKATGISKKRLRYSISGAAGFSIHERRGRIAYDGTAINGQQAILNVTASDKRGKAESASLGITVRVERAAVDVSQLAVPVVTGIGAVVEALAQMQTPTNYHPTLRDGTKHPWKTVDCRSKPKYLPGGVRLIYDRYVLNGSSYRVILNGIHWDSLGKHGVQEVAYASQPVLYDLPYAQDWWRQCHRSQAAIELVNHCIRTGGDCVQTTENFEYTDLEQLLSDLEANLNLNS